MNGYNLTREWYSFKFENCHKVKAIHSDMYFYIIDLWNRLGQKKNIGLPTSVTMECLGIGSYNTYKKTLQDLIDFGFIELIQESKNQYNSKIIAISKIDKATDKALDKATIKATDKALDKATDSINKQINNRTNKQINIPTLKEFGEFAILKKPNVNKSDVKLKYDAWIENEWKDGNNKKIVNWKSKLLQTLPHLKENINTNNIKTNKKAL